MCALSVPIGGAVDKELLEQNPLHVVVGEPQSTVGVVTVLIVGQTLQRRSCECNRMRGSHLEVPGDPVGRGAESGGVHSEVAVDARGTLWMLSALDPLVICETSDGEQVNVRGWVTGRDRGTLGCRGRNQGDTTHLKT